MPTASPTVRDNPGLWWLAALLFFSVGTAFVYLGITNQAGVPAWPAVLATGMGLAGIGTGIWLAWESPLSVVTLDRVAQELRLTQLGLFGRRAQTVRFSEVQEVIVERRADDEGSPMARPALALQDGRRLPLSALWRHDTESIARVVALIQAQLSDPVS